LFEQVLFAETKTDRELSEIEAGLFYPEAVSRTQSHTRGPLISLANYNLDPFS
jgi:hypothetical protein